MGLRRHVNPSRARRRIAGRRPSQVQTAEGLTLDDQQLCMTFALSLWSAPLARLGSTFSTC